MFARLTAWIEAIAVRCGLPPELARQAVSFGIIGLGSTAVYSATIAGLVQSGTLPPLPAAAAGFVTGTLFSYVLNSLVSFRAPLKTESLVRYTLVTLVGFGLNMSIMWLVVDALRQPYGWGIVAVTGTVPVFNFAGHKFFTYRGHVPAGMA